MNNEFASYVAILHSRTVDRRDFQTQHQRTMATGDQQKIVHQEKLKKLDCCGGVCVEMEFDDNRLLNIAPRAA